MQRNRGKQQTRDLFKKIGGIKAIFHARIGTIKNRNGKELTEAEEIKKSGKNTHTDDTKKVFYDSDNHDGVVTHRGSDILEHEVKWALGSITTNKASGCDGIPVELFQILKYDAGKVVHSVQFSSVNSVVSNSL